MVQHGVSSVFGSDKGLDSKGISVGSANRSSVQREMPTFMQIPADDDFSGMYAHTKLNRSLAKLSREAYENDMLVSFGPVSTKNMPEDWKKPLDLAEFFQVNGVSLNELAKGVYTEMESPYGALFRYFLRTSIVYVETPEYKYDPTTKTRSKSVKKELYTSNIDLARAWDESESIKGKLPTKFDNVDEPITVEVLRADEAWLSDSNGDTFREFIDVCRPTKPRGGQRKIVNPRNQLNVGEGGIKFMPLFILNELAEVIHSKALEGAVGIDFVRENGAVRDLVTTLKLDNIESVYGERITEEVREVAFNGDFFDGEGTEPGSGYIKLASIGESKYDSIMRSVTLARVVGLETGRQPDMTYVNIRIDIVDAEFLNAITRAFEGNLPGVDIDEIMLALHNEKISNLLVQSDPYEAETWVKKMRTIEGTTFLRKLTLFMLGHRDWFPDFSAAANGLTSMAQVEKVQSAGVKAGGGDSHGLL